MYSLSASWAINVSPSGFIHSLVFTYREKAAVSLWADFSQAVGSQWRKVLLTYPLFVLLMIVQLHILLLPELSRDAVIDHLLIFNLYLSRPLPFLCVFLLFLFCFVVTLWPFRTPESEASLKRFWFLNPCWARFAQKPVLLLKPGGVRTLLCDLKLVL